MCFSEKETSIELTSEPVRKRRALYKATGPWWWGHTSPQERGWRAQLRICDGLMVGAENMNSQRPAVMAASSWLNL